MNNFFFNIPFQNLLMLPQCTFSWRSWTKTTITQIAIRYKNCDSTIFQKKFFSSYPQSFIKTSETFYIVASFYPFTALHRHLARFQHLLEKKNYYLKKQGISIACIRNVFKLPKPRHLSPNYAQLAPFCSRTSPSFFRD